MSKAKIPAEANFISLGRGLRIIVIRGLAASSQDWDFLRPDFIVGGKAGHSISKVKAESIRIRYVPQVAQ